MEAMALLYVSAALNALTLMGMLALARRVAALEGELHGLRNPVQPQVAQVA
jgi:hypothetical protein